MVGDVCIIRRLLGTRLLRRGGRFLATVDQDKGDEMGLKFLNTAEALKDSTGYGNADYYQSGDIHLKTSGLKVLLNYLCTHAYETEDRRPDTNNIPRRAEYVPDPVLLWLRPAVR